MDFFDHWVFDYLILFDNWMDINAWWISPILWMITGIYFWKIYKGIKQYRYEMKLDRHIKNFRARKQEAKQKDYNAYKSRQNAISKPIKEGKNNE